MIIETEENKDKSVTFAEKVKVRQFTEQQKPRKENSFYFTAKTDDQTNDTNQSSKNFATSKFGV